MHVRHGSEQVTELLSFEFLHYDLHCASFEMPLIILDIIDLMKGRVIKDETLQMMYMWYSHLAFSFHLLTCFLKNRLVLI